MGLKLIYCMSDLNNAAIRNGTLIKLVGNALKNGLRNVDLKYQIRSENLRKSTAYRIYGRTNVDRWLKEKLIEISIDGNKGTVLNRAELEKIAKSSNRMSYLSVIERAK